MINPAEIQAMKLLNKTGFLVSHLNINKIQTSFITVQLVHNSHSPWFFRAPQTNVGETRKLLRKLPPPIIVRKLPLK